VTRGQEKPAVSKAAFDSHTRYWSVPKVLPDHAV